MQNRNISRRDFFRIAASTTAALAVDWSHLNTLMAKIGPKEKLPGVETEVVINLV